MKTIWKFLIPVPLALALLAMVPQAPDAAAQGTSNQDVTQGTNKEDVATTVRMAELQYVDRAGQVRSVPARTILVLRLLEGAPNGMRLEINYENGDYSMVDVQGFHLIRAGRDQQDVRLIRSRVDRMSFPRLP
jgi:hypothetical protein